MWPSRGSEPRGSGPFDFLRRLESLPLMARRALKIAVAAGVALGVAYAAASSDRCGDWPAAPPELKSVSASRSPFSAGAAKVAIQVPLPVVVAGYGPPRPEARRAEPLHARALVLESAGVRLALVSLEVLLVPPELQARVKAELAGLELSALVVAATHPHSSVGGLDRRLVAELAGTGRFREDVEAALVRAAVEAVRAAFKAKTTAALEVGRTQAGQEVVNRSGAEPDRRLLRLRFLAPAPIAQLLVVAAHPTLVPRDTQTLSGDYPAALAELLEGEGQGVTLVLQGAGGNASAAPPESGAKAMATVLALPLAALPDGVRESAPALSIAQVAVALPRPELTRTAPPGTRGLAENAFCAEAPRTVELTLLELGPARLLAVPFEVTKDAAAVLEQAAGGAQTLSLANGYFGYLDSPGAVQAGEGEARRQYFPAGLAQVLAEGAALGAQVLAASQRQP